MAFIYRPKHHEQIAEGGPTGDVDCTAWSGAHFADRATLGGVYIPGRTIRLRSSEPKPNPGSPGLNIDQVAAVLREFNITVTVRHGDWQDVIHELDEGRGVMIAIDYDQLHRISCQPTFLDFHAGFINNRSRTGRLLWYDSLCKDYKYVDELPIRRAAEKFANNTGLGVYHAYTRVTPNVAKLTN